MVSIIIPVYNASSFIDQCLESVIKQSFHNWECILINDGSKDNSGKICDKWCQKDSRIRVIHQQNKGVSAARNRGIEESKGKYIVFIDSDDWVEPRYLSDMIKENNKDLDLIVTGTNHYRQEEIATTFKPYQKNTIIFSAEDSEIFINNIGLLYGPYSKLFKSEIIKKNNITFPLEYSLGEDLLFNFEYLKHIKQLHYIPVANYNYRIFNTGSLTSIPRDNLFDIHYHQWKIQKKFLINKGMWNDISKDYFYTKLWGIIYNGLFNKKRPKLIYIKNILNIDEINELKKWNTNFVCSMWIKTLILHKQNILLFLILNTKK